jgi:hypothetical protein
MGFAGAAVAGGGGGGGAAFSAFSFLQAASASMPTNGIRSDCRVSCSGKAGSTVSWREAGQAAPYGFPEVGDGFAARTAQQRLPLREGRLTVPNRPVDGSIPRSGSRRLDPLADAADLVAGRLSMTTVSPGWCVGSRMVAKTVRKACPFMALSSSSGSVRAVEGARGRVGCGLVDEHEAIRVEVALALEPRLVRRSHVLLGRVDVICFARCRGARRSARGYSGPRRCRAWPGPNGFRAWGGRAAPRSGASADRRPSAWARRDPHGRNAPAIDRRSPS